MRGDIWTFDGTGEFKTKTGVHAGSDVEVFVRLVAGTVVDYADLEWRLLVRRMEEKRFGIIIESSMGQSVLPFAAVAGDVARPQGVFDWSFVSNVEVCGLDDHEDAGLRVWNLWCFGARCSFFISGRYKLMAVDAVSFS